MGHFCPPGSGSAFQIADPDPATQINADPDPAIQINADPDPKPCAEIIT